MLIFCGEDDGSRDTRPEESVEVTDTEVIRTTRWKILDHPKNDLDRKALSRHRSKCDLGDRFIVIWIPEECLWRYVFIHDQDQCIEIIRLT